MFTYDGIRSQLEWNSTLSVSNAPTPTADTKFLRKVSCLLTFHPLFNHNLADLDHRNYRYV
jgi:pyruvate kinase